MQEFAPWLGFLFGLCLNLALVYQVLHERRAPTATLAWIGFLLLIPFVSAAIYLLIGRRKRRLPHKSRPRVRYGIHQPIASAQTRGLDRLLRRLNVPGAIDGNAVQIHAQARAARLALIEIIDQAQQSVWMVVYSLEDDPTGHAVLAALTRAAQRGVIVRAVVDDMGSWWLKGAEVRALRDAGGVLLRFKPMWFALRRRMINLRNHRKIVVADGLHVWSGGRNIGDEYLADDAEEKWVDLAFSLSGPAAAVFGDVVRSDYLFAASETASAEDTQPGVESAHCGDQRVQVLSSGPDHSDDVWHIAFIKACFDARERIWLATPYFIPDEAVMNALATAVRAGVDVHIIVPRHSDHRIIDWVSRGYLRELQAVGAQVWRYAPGMLHAKAAVFDQHLTVIGSANLDYRSFFLNYEQMTLFYDEKINQEMAALIDAWRKNCRSDLKTPGVLNQTLLGAARLLAPLL